MQALIPKATLLQGLRPNLNEGDHCVPPWVQGGENFADWGEVHLISRGNASHSVISHQNFGEKSGFSKGLCLGGSHFSKCLGRKGFREEFEFSDFCLGKSDF